MKKQIAVLLLAALVLTACGEKDKNTGTVVEKVPKAEQLAPIEEAPASIPTEETDNEKSEAGITVDPGLLNVDVTISAESAELLGMTFTSQEEADEAAKNGGFKSIRLNDDGGITMTMSKSKHKEMMQSIKEGIDKSMEEMVNSDDYPHFSRIEANSNYTEFKVTTTTQELNLQEEFSVLGFYIYGGLYNSFNGTPVDNVHIDMIDATTGEVYDTADSKNMGDGAAAQEPADTTDYSSQLETSEYSAENSYATMHFIVIKNNSDKTLSVSSNSVAKSADGSTIGAGSGGLDAIAPGQEQCIREYFDGVSGIDHYETTLSASAARYYDDATVDISTEAAVLEDKVILTCTNNGTDPAMFVEGLVMFMQGEKCVYYSTNYLVDDSSELKPGASISKQFNSYGEPFDGVKYYITGRREG